MQRLLLVVLSCSALFTQLAAQATRSGFGVITGRVLAGDGAPVKDSVVHAFYSVNHDGKLPVEVAKAGKTDERGEYRIEEVSPGTYYVLAGPPAALLQQDPSYRHTYYPGEVAFGAAVALEARANTVLRGIDIRLRKSPGVVVSGTVVRPQVDTPELKTNEILDMRIEADHPFMDFVASTSSSARFQFPSVPPGRYVLNTLIWEQDEQGRHVVFDSRQTLEVGKSGPTDVVVMVNPTRTLSGKIVSETGERLKFIGFAIFGRTTGMGSLGSIDGSFSFPFPAGLYRVRSGDPSLCSFKSVRLGDVEVGGSEFEFTGTNGPLLITVNPGCSSSIRQDSVLNHL